ncbi:Endothelial Cell-Selective Adhesion Molecule [Manis pentadactyla]|nr:Endothelial Cell-Selective Adhesion Molecule [Manis pentadactyla]
MMMMAMGLIRKLTFIYLVLARAPHYSKRFVGHISSIGISLRFCQPLAQSRHTLTLIPGTQEKRTGPGECSKSFGLLIFAAILLIIGVWEPYYRAEE